MSKHITTRHTEHIYYINNKKLVKVDSLNQAKLFSRDVDPKIKLRIREGGEENVLIRVYKLCLMSGHGHVRKKTKKRMECTCG